MTRLLLSAVLALSQLAPAGPSRPAAPAWRDVYAADAPVAAQKAPQRPEYAVAESDSAPPAPRASVAVRASGVSGVASWYCGSGSPCSAGYPASGMYAAASAALQRAIGPGWRGSRVLVARDGLGAAAVEVVLVDTCGCPGGRVIDLYASAFSVLAPLSRGVAAVTVSLP